MNRRTKSRWEIDFSEAAVMLRRMAREKREFLVFLERDEDGFYVASVPALPGCHTQARTLPALRKRVREAISLCLEVAKSDAGYRACLEKFSYSPTFVGIETVEV